MATADVVTISFAFGYLVLVILARWWLIAKPSWQRTKARFDGLSHRSADHTSANSLKWENLTPRCGARWLSHIFLWHLEAAWRSIHAAEDDADELLSPGEVRAKLESLPKALAVVRRKELKDRATELGEQISTALAEDDSAFEGRAHLPKNEHSSYLKMLLHEAETVRHREADGEYGDTIAWHNKVLWLLTTALVIMVALTLAVGNGVFFLVGAAGGLFGRLARGLRPEGIEMEYSRYWTTFFLSPVVGALGAWAGILLVGVAHAGGILGSAFLSASWHHPCDPLTLGAAFAFGLSERLIDRMIAAVEEPAANATEVDPSPPPNSHGTKPKDKS